MWGAQEKSRGHIKKISAGANVPPLANCFRRHYGRYMCLHRGGGRWQLPRDLDVRGRMSAEKCHLQHYLTSLPVT